VIGNVDSRKSSRHIHNYYFHSWLAAQIRSSLLGRSVGEIKSFLDRRKLEIAETELEEKVQRLPFKDRYQQVLTKVFCLEAKNLKNKDQKWIGGDDILRVLR